MADTLPVRRILLLRPSALGDVCRTVPVLASLRAQWPAAEIYWVVQSNFASAIEAHPALTGVIEFPRERFRGGLLRPHRWWGMIRWLRSLRADAWDIALDCQGLARTGLMVAACGAKMRVGDRAAREGAWIPCTRRVRVPDTVHEVDRMLALVEAIGAPPVLDATLAVPPAASSWWGHPETERPRGPYAVLATTSRWVSKAWPSERWVDLAARLVQHGHVEWIALPGSAGEQQCVAATANAMRARGISAVDYAGKTDVGQMMAVINGAALTVSNDSAALHMAMGLGERCLGLFGPTDPAKVGPWRRPDLALRPDLRPGEAPSFRDRSIGDSVMRRLPVEVVATRATELLEQWSA